MTAGIRQARLDDAIAISALLRTRIERWQRFTEAGAVEDCQYKDLSIAERWLHGGAWMSVETAAIHLSQLLTRASIPLVAEEKRRIVGYLEAHHSKEEEPFGDHWGISYLLGPEGNTTRQTEKSLLEYLQEYMLREGPERILIMGIPQADDEWLRTSGFSRTARLLRFRLGAQQGHVFFRANPHTDEDAAQIVDWYISIGRICNARYTWEREWQQLWDKLLGHEEGLRVDRFRLTLPGQEALVCARQLAYHRQCVKIALWSRKPLSVQLIIALREWAYRQKYRELELLVNETDVPILGENAEADGFSLDIYALDIDEELTALPEV